jgi:hypothetical protein
MTGGQRSALVLVSAVLAMAAPAWAQTGDPQLKTDHPCSPGLDGNGVLDGNDDWDHDGIPKKNDATPGIPPAPPAPPSGGKAGDGGGGCGLLGLEVLVFWLFRRPRRQGTWRRTNGRRWVLDS